MALLIGALAVEVSAQEGLRDRDPTIDAAREVAGDLQRASFHNGPFYLLSRFELADIGFDQAYFVPTADQGGVSLAVSAPHRLYFVPSKKVALSVDVKPSYAIIDVRSSRRGQFGYTTRGDARFLFNHLYLDFYGAYADEVRANTGEINRLSTVRDRVYGVDGEMKYSSRTGLRFLAAYHDLTHPYSRFQPPVEIPVYLLDRHDTRYRLQVNHKTFPLTQLFAFGETGQYRFDFATYKNARRNYAGGGLNFDNGRTAAHLEAGPASLTFKQAGQKGFHGLLGQSSLSRGISPRLTLTGSLGRDIDFSILDQNNYYIIDRASITSDYAATRRLTLRFLAQSGRNRYVVPVGGINRLDKINWVSVGWLYTVRHLRGGFDIGYFDRTSNFPDADQENGIRLIVHLSFIP